MKIAVILPAAGLGNRFAAASEPSSPGSGSKIESDLLGRPVFLRAIELFAGRSEVVQIILAVHPDALDEFKLRWGEKLSFLGVTVVAGGRIERWETVQNALKAINPQVTHVAVHDAARPLTDVKIINRVIEASQKYSAVIPGIPAAATLKKIKAIPAANQVDPLADLLGAASKTTQPLGQVVGVIDRRDVVEVQTPQVFEVNLLRKAYAQIVDGKMSQAPTTAITDDAMLVEALGEPVMVIEGASTNFKITRPEDLDLARAWLNMTQANQPAAAARKRLRLDDDD